MPFDLSAYGVQAPGQLYTPQAPSALAAYGAPRYGQMYQGQEGYGPPMSGQGPPGYLEAHDYYQQAKRAWKQEAAKSLFSGGKAGNMGAANTALAGAAKGMASTL